MGGAIGGQRLSIFHPGHYGGWRVSRDTCEGTILLIVGERCYSWRFCVARVKGYFGTCLLYISSPLYPCS